MTRLQPSVFGGWKRPSSQGGGLLKLSPHSIPTSANLAVLGEGKELLFGELNQLVRFGVPLEEALKLVGSSWRRHARMPLEMGLRRDSPLPTFMFLFDLLVVTLTSLHGILWRNPRRVARLMAARLGSQVQAGFSLAGGMTACGALFSPEEIRLIRFGEESGNLGESLESLASFHRTDRQSMSALNGLFYPLFLLLYIVAITSFIVFTIVPKFEDIFMQLGAELPEAFMAMLWLFGDSPGIFSLLGLCTIGLAVGAWALWCSRFLNGTVWGGYLSFFLFLAFPPVGTIVFGMLFVPVAAANQAWGTPAGVGVFLGIASAVIVSRRMIIRTWEATARRFDRRIMAVGRFIPLLSAALREDDEARWLLALSAGIRAGLPLNEAMAEAAGMAPPRFAKRTAAMASDLSNGLTLQEAMDRARFPSALTRYRLSWMERTGTLRESILQLVGDKRSDVSDRLTRALKGLEVLCVILCGAVVGFVALAMYSPLFSIPSALIRQSILN